MNIVMLAQNRHRLTQQAIQSLRANTSGEWTLTIVDDGSEVVAEGLLATWTKLDERIRVVRHATPQGPGPSRNAGIAAESARGRGEWLYLCDQDCYFLPGWDRALTTAFTAGEEFGFRVMAGYVHPYNQTNAIVRHGEIELHEKYAVGLLSWLWKWESFDKYGPFDLAVQANSSEDWAMSHKIRLDGGRVGCVHPAVIINCGLTGSSGKLSPGSEFIFRQAIPEGVRVE